MTALVSELVDTAPAPQDAKYRLERILEGAREVGVSFDNLDEDTKLVLKVCIQRAPYLATLLARDPARLLRVGADSYLHRAKPLVVIKEELGRLCGDIEKNFYDSAKLDEILRLYRADEMVRLGVREMELGSPVEVGEELSALADACLDEAIDYHGACMRERYGAPVQEDGLQDAATLVVIAMGKMGGNELNFSSDIDLIYFYSSDEGQAGDLTLQEYFSKLCRRVSASIGDVTEQDCVFRVDLRLRPEGSQGVIANSLRSAESYYESFGRPWERQAWLKARPCAGDLELGAELMKMMRPFIYPRTVSPKLIDEVRSLNRRIKRELGAGEVDTGYDLKNGRGGIREVEFFVQGLQLVHASHRPKLQTQSTMDALNELLFGGLVTEEERRGLAEAYRFLRHLEHMVQLDSGRQTQRLPARDDDLDLLAKRSKLEGLANLRELLAVHTSFVAKTFESLGEDPSAPRAEVIALLRGGQERETEERLLAVLGFRAPQQAWVDFDAARKRTFSPFGPSAMDASLELAPYLLEEVASSPDPDLALVHVRDLIARRGTWTSLWSMMRDNRELLRLLTSVFGTSEYLSKHFIQHPELFDALLTSGLAKPMYSRQELARALAERNIAQLEDREEQWNALAEFKNAQVLRIGLADIAGALKPREVCQQLSVLAELCVQAAYDLVAGDLVERHGSLLSEEGEDISLSVLAMGKLGGRELGYASDLDLVFVYTTEGESDGQRPLDAVTYMTRIAQRLMRGLTSLHPGGRLYEIDTRLRPSGSQGLLVSSLAAWQRYHEGSAQLWEKQSLTKMRWVAGHAELGARARRIADECIYAPTERSQEQLAQGIADMRDRIWNELGSRQGFDLKVGYGGLIDIEFAAQYLQLLHGPTLESLRTPNTTEALSEAMAAGLCDEDDTRLLLEGYAFLRRLEHRLRIVHDRSEHRLPSDDAELAKLARRAGYSEADQLVVDFKHWSTEIHRAYRDILGIAAS